MVLEPRSQVCLVTGWVLVILVPSCLIHEMEQILPNLTGLLWLLNEVAYVNVQHSHWYIEILDKLTLVIFPLQFSEEQLTTFKRLALREFSQHGSWNLSYTLMYCFHLLTQQLFITCLFWAEHFGSSWNPRGKPNRLDPFSHWTNRQGEKKRNI